MTALDLRRVRALIEAVHTLAGPERARFLDAACAGEPALRAEVEALLFEAEGAPDFLASPHTAREPVPARRTLPEAFAAGERLDDFHLVRPIGSGGMGTVWEALQVDPPRRVALKTLRAGEVSSEAAHRFRREVHILALLRHPAIAQVLASGVQTVEGLGEVPWYALEFVDGARSLTRHAQEERLDRTARLRLFITLCRAVQHGHERGVVHRDLKPTNVLVDVHGALKVIDFGIARVEREDGGRTSFATGTGQVIGTLHYMSPEQLAGEATDARSDVYALGVMLYELLTDALPHASARLSLPEAARLLAEAPVRAPSTRVAGISPDLDAITLHALEKDRARRPATAGELADDVERFLRGEPVRARTPGRARLALAFTRRHRVLVGAATVVFVSLTAATILSLAFAVRAERAERRAVQQRDEARLAQYTADLHAADAALEGADLLAAGRRLEAAPAEHKGLEWWLLARRLDTLDWRRAVLGRGVSALVAHPDGRHVYVATPDGALEEREARAGTLLARVDDTGAISGRLALDEAGRTLVVGYADGRVGLFETRPLRPLRSWKTHATEAVAGIDGAGTLVVSAGTDGDVVARDASGGALRWNVRGPREGALALSVAPDGGLVAIGGSSTGVVRVLDARDGSLRATLDCGDASVRDVAFSPDGTRLAATTHERRIQLWSLPELEPEGFLVGHTDLVWDIAFSADGRRLASTGWDHAVRLWDPATREPLGAWTGHAANALAVALLPDGTHLVSGDEGGRIVGWNLGAHDREVVPVRGKWYWHLAFFPDGDEVLAIHGGFAERLSADTREVVARYPYTDGAEWRAGAPAPDGDVVALGDEHGWLEIHAADGSGRRTRVHLAGSAIQALDWDPAGGRLAIGAGDGTALLLDRDEDARIALTTASTAIAALRFAPDGARLAIAGEEGRLDLYDVTGASAQRVATIPLGARVAALAWSPDGVRVAAALGNGRAALVDARHGRVERALEGHEAALSDLAFTPDGRRLLTASFDRTLRFWDVARGLEVASFGQRRSDLAALALGPDGGRLVTGSTDSTLHWWPSAPPAARALEQVAERVHARERILAALRAEADLGPAVRRAALALAEARPDDCAELAREAWVTARAPLAPRPACERALEIARAAAVHEPPDGLARAAAALALVRLERPAEARELLERAPGPAGPACAVVLALAGGAGAAPAELPAGPLGDDLRRLLDEAHGNAGR